VIIAESGCASNAMIPSSNRSCIRRGDLLLDDRVPGRRHREVSFAVAPQDRIEGGGIGRI